MENYTARDRDLGNVGAAAESESLCVSSYDAMAVVVDSDLMLIDSKFAVASAGGSGSSPSSGYLLGMFNGENMSFNTTSNTASWLCAMPMEVLSRIVSYLPMKTVRSLIQMSKKLNGVALYDHPDFQELTFPMEYLAAWHLFCYKYITQSYDTILTKRLFFLMAADTKRFVENSTVEHKPALVKYLYPPMYYLPQYVRMPDALAQLCYEEIKDLVDIVQLKITNESIMLRNTHTDEEIAALRKSPHHPFPQQRVTSALLHEVEESGKTVKKLIEACLDVHCCYLMRTSNGSSSGARLWALVSELNLFNEEERKKRLEILRRCDMYNYKQVFSPNSTCCNCGASKAAMSPFKQGRKQANFYLDAATAGLSVDSFFTSEF